MNIKRLLLIVIAFLSITFAANAQYKINVECKNNTHDTYYFTGHITDGSSTQFWSIYVPAGATKNVYFIVNSSLWVRQDARISHTSYTPPRADFIGNDPGPHYVYAPNNPNNGYVNKCHQDLPSFFPYSKFYYYRIEAI